MAKRLIVYIVLCSSYRPSNNAMNDGGGMSGGGDMGAMGNDGAMDDLTENIDCNRDKIWVNGHCKPDFLEFESEATMAKLEPRNSFKIQHSEGKGYGIEIRNRFEKIFYHFVVHVFK
ncbi:hypothetical protein LOAG_13908 [Loa loa]|uniref:Uncharacterized protein n=1 Tax=Loa loa TaxID=7209 RepID=A0A1S0TII2_LOALO|nr:hypothetical protein LOAG_13908 [Loa loa]EFO14610.2 hypothetical protein LOAG_13908 [Loa loa]